MVNRRKRGHTLLPIKDSERFKKKLALSLKTQKEWAEKEEITLKEYQDRLAAKLTKREKRNGK